MTGCIIVAAGRGTRFKDKTPKTFFLLRDSPMIEYSLRTFSNCALIDEIVLVLQKRFIKSRFVSIWKRHFPKIRAVVQGGRFREESVFNGFLRCSKDCDIILIHDGARPFVSCRLIQRVVKGALRYGSCVPAYPPNGSVKLVRNRKLVKTMNHKGIEIAQTPQGFSRYVLERIFFSHGKELGKYADESSICENSGFPVHIIRGEVTNIKITTRE
ncbi:MAG: 2-C-methyl-D-erythritol 4-phosphate cytidylyltransferase, partial [Candidatus Omnitrophica bacterium]|nr:2-C-methyl-D-erythritol 4-phosphate cytidylyltransferase [Candidatus Omnitrophota bacterium]